MRSTDLDKVFDVIVDKDLDPSIIQRIRESLEEYLKTFIIVGYDTRGRSFICSTGQTEQDYDSLEVLLGRVTSLIEDDREFGGEEE